MKTEPANICIVMPAFEERTASTILIETLRDQFGERLTCIIVDDGSVREPVESDVLSSRDIKGSVIYLKRNVGHQRAIAIGLCYAEEHEHDSDFFVVMDSDGEDRPETIETLLSALERDDLDVAVAARRKRVESLRFKIFYELYRLLFILLTGRRISFGNFMAMTPAGLRRLAAMQEIYTHIAGSVITSRLRVTACPIARGPRLAGQSRMNFVSLALHGFRAVMLFAEDVLVRVGVACALVAVLSVIAGVIAVGLKLFGYATPGWFSVAIGILMLVFLQTGAVTLMTLLLTGVVKGGNANRVRYLDFVQRVERSGEPHT
jgi:cellulose synthase/poly-beta-1,6-N-acetylglucosamine synthase-like glycosyltransferase